MSLVSQILLKSFKNKQAWNFKRYTFWQIFSAINSRQSQLFAAGLLKLGLKKGDTLGVWGGNHYEWLLAYLAAFQIGIITVKYIFKSLNQYIHVLVIEQVRSLQQQYVI